MVVDEIASCRAEPKIEPSRKRDVKDRQAELEGLTLSTHICPQLLAVIRDPCICSLVFDTNVVVTRGEGCGGAVGMVVIALSPIAMHHAHCLAAHLKIAIRVKKDADASELVF